RSGQSPVRRRGPKLEARMLRSHSFSVLILLFVICLAVLCSSEANAQARRRPRSSSTISSQAANPAQTASQFKGILEPVNYGQDINLTDVFFVSPDVGWVSGEHAT